MRLLFVTVCCFAMSTGMAAAQAGGGAGKTHVADPGTSPTPGPTNPSLPGSMPPEGLGTGSRGLTGNDEVHLPRTPEEAGAHQEKPATK